MKNQEDSHMLNTGVRPTSRKRDHPLTSIWLETLIRSMDGMVKCLAFIAESQ